MPFLRILFIISYILYIIKYIIVTTNLYGLKYRTTREDMMPLNIEDSRMDLIAKLDNLIQHKLKEPEASLIREFLNQYYFGVSPYDLRQKTLDELYGALVSHWRMLYQRMPGESKVKVYNPQIEQHGWQSPHTIIEIIHENKPFLLESIRLALNRLGIRIRLLIHAAGIRFERNALGKITKVLPIDLSITSDASSIAEAPIFIEIDRQTDIKVMHTIAEKINQVLSDLDLIVRDWSKMLTKLTDIIATIEDTKYAIPPANLHEVIDFLRWLASDHFTFIGFAEYSFSKEGNGPIIMNHVANSSLGILSDPKIVSQNRNLDDMFPPAKAAILNDQILLLGKTDNLATVHRPAYTDFVAIKIFDKEGKLIRLMRFIGLYTSSVYNSEVETIPFIRQRIERIFDMTGFKKDSHDGKTLLHIIETLPRDELFQAQDNELFDFAIGILHIQERPIIKLFMRRDIYGRFFSCMVFVPRDLYNSDLRNKIEKILVESLQGLNVSSNTKFSESILAMVHFIIHVEQEQEIPYNREALETKIVDAARTWNQNLDDELNDYFGEAEASVLFKAYAKAFPVSYKENTNAQVAVIDIEHMERLTQLDNDLLEMSLYRPIEDSEDSFRFKIFRRNKTIPLSDIVPILEHMGLRIITERSYEIKLINQTIWINDYKMVHPSSKTMDPDLIKEKFQDAFDAIWHNRVENDAFNCLVLNADLNWRDINILRAYSKYLWQAGMVFSQSYVEDALANNADFAIKLIKYFYIKFDINSEYQQRQESLDSLKKIMYDNLENVASLNEDRIIRSFIGVIDATIRTNFFQKNKNDEPKDYLSFKLDSSKVPDLPLPKPLYEIFVYNTQVEAVHLRAEKVARGGIRWSDRSVDFRTEVLGLMKAQQVKNAVIVPLGAKGGFIVKQDLLTLPERSERQKVVIECYKTFIRGMLDLTDNYAGKSIVKPKNVLCWDNDDPYLVVAADKGTATFSDIANDLSKEYNFWLGDAFASGGRYGYDHKKMGITARGAWESVKMHFQRLGIDTQMQPFTVLGIGDMAGDVFGNGMLMSEQIRLVAAFNHMHIFIDPNPDPIISFNERKRLFTLPQSTWADYDPNLISKGGGVFLRSSKRIAISPEMKSVLNCTADFMEPNELLRCILKMPVDLFFNGGIGTFVKASFERNLDVGDRINDLIRVNGEDLNARVVCEGGNLGFTQLGRIEYAKKGGIINTDAIDNSGGVNCSDTEVNIKILLNEMVGTSDLTEKQRNELLFSMTDNVAQLVLENNRKQNEALTLADSQAADNLQMHSRLQRDLEINAGLDPNVEFLPDGEEVALRVVEQRGYTRPEMAVLMAYTKIYLKRKLEKSSLPDDPYVFGNLISYFPKALHEPKFIPFIKTHRLSRDILATQISNYVVNEMGINFMLRLSEETGSDIAELTKAFMIAREVFDIQNIIKEIRDLGCKVPMNIQINMWQELSRLVRRATRWFARTLHGKLDIEKNIKKYKPNIAIVAKNLDKMLCGSWLDHTLESKKDLLATGVPEHLANIVSKFYAMYTSLDIVEAAFEYNYDLIEIGKVYFQVGTDLDLGCFGELIKKQPVHNYWEALARSSFRDDVDLLQRDLTVNILKKGSANENDAAALVKRWVTEHKDILHRWNILMNELKTSDPGFTMFAISLRELLDVARTIGL